MIQVQMGTVLRYHPSLQLVLRVTGGWKARVPSIQAESWAETAYATYFVACGIPSDKAHRLAQSTIQRIFVQGYTKGLREAVARRAAEYAEMWPALCIHVSRSTQRGRQRGKPIVELRGFDPRVVAESMYVPYQNTGRAGQEYVKGMLADMGRQANDQQ